MDIGKPKVSGKLVLHMEKDSEFILVAKEKSYVTILLEDHALVDPTIIRRIGEIDL